MTLPYNVQYVIAWLNAAAGIVAAILAGAGLTLHPSWLSGDVAATAGVVSLVCAGLSQILPPVTRTPAQRETKYLQAVAGILPDDLAAKHGTPLLVTTVPPAG